MRVSNHIKAKWAMRGDYERTAKAAWNSGVEVVLPNYQYGKAVYDREANVVLLSQGDKITTVIRRYPHTEMLPFGEVECKQCGEVFQGRDTCPSCSTSDW